MATPVQLTFRDMPHSDAVEAHVFRRAAKLDQFQTRISHVHVVVEMPHRHKTHGQRFHVRIGVHVPGRELVVSKTSPNGGEDLNALLDESFADAERQLAEAKPRWRAARRSASVRYME
jgi:ribosomal subunit interface protein